MTTYKLTVGPVAPSTAENYELTTHGPVRYRADVDGPASVRFDIDGRSTEALEIEDLATDLHVRRNDAKIFRGRCRTGRDLISANEHRTDIIASDYRAFLTNFRIIGADGREFTATDQATIAKTLIDEAQALTAGNLGIDTTGITTHGTTRTIGFRPGIGVGAAINEVSRTDDGFEWTIDPDLDAILYPTGRGSTKAETLDFGGKVRGVDRNTTVATYANHVLGTGGPDAGVVTATSATIATDPRGRIELATGFPDVDDPDLLIDRVAWLAAENRPPPPRLRPPPPPRVLERPRPPLARRHPHHRHQVRPRQRGHHVPHRVRSD